MRVIGQVSSSFNHHTPGIGQALHQHGCVRGANQRIPVALSYVTGSHAIKIGGQQGWGPARYDRSFNGDLVQLYRNGRPDSVQTRNSPNVGSQTNFKYTGLYVQDSWTTGRITISPGLRYDHLDNSFPALDQPA